MSVPTSVEEWTTIPPKVPGWYWVRDPKTRHDKQIVNVDSRLVAHGTRLSIRQFNVDLAVYEWCPVQDSPP